MFPGFESGRYMITIRSFFSRPLFDRPNLIKSSTGHESTIKVGDEVTVETGFNETLDAVADEVKKDGVWVRLCKRLSSVRNRSQSNFPGELTLLHYAPPSVAFPISVAKFRRLKPAWSSSTPSTLATRTTSVRMGSLILAPRIILLALIGC